VINFVGGVFAVAFFIGGNLWFYFRFFSQPRAEVMEEDTENLPGDFK
jgi:hypothetical protein